MHHTIFDTPVINTLLRGVSVGFLRLTGWTIEGALPAGASKSVLIAAPHTSNWDLPYTLMVAFALRLNVYWMGKEQLFRPPFRGVMRWLGGIPVNRAQAGNLVAASVAALQQAPGPRCASLMATARAWSCWRHMGCAWRGRQTATRR